MNRVFLASFFVFLVFTSCESGGTGKVADAVKNIEEKKFKDNGEKVQSLAIDSLKYEPASMQNFYSDESDKQMGALETYSERLQVVTDTSNPALRDAVQTKAQRQLDIFKQLQELSLSADTSKNLYSVEYFLNAKTDKNTYQRKVQKYLYQDNLNEVVLDSRYRSEDF